MASIQRVLSVEPIENADAIEKIRVLGWQMVAKKGEFKPGDFCVFCEIDCQVPEHPEFEFLRGKKFRVRTAKFRGCLSQGLALPLSNPYVREKLGDGLHVEVAEGQDVSEVLGFYKYDPPIPEQLKGKVKGNFPTHIVPKTDELRAQSYINDRENVMAEFVGRDVYITQKCDGTSYTAYFKDGKFGVCSRNMELLPDDANTHWKITRQYDIENKLRNFVQWINEGSWEWSKPKNIAIQGEICGEGIQKNRMGIKGCQLFLFNIWDIDEHRYLNFKEFVEAAKALDLPTVPIQQQGIRFGADWTLDQLLDMAKGKYPGTKNHREGIVIRPVVECFSGVLDGRLSIKVINNDYLLNDGE